MQSAIVASVLILAVTIHQGLAIRCFECNSHTNTACAQDIPPSNLSIDCGTHKHGVTYTFCRKITQVIEFSVNNLPPDSRVIRGCGWDNSNYKNECYQRAGFGGRQEVCACSTDDCNSAGSLESAFITIASASIALILYFKQF